MLHRDKIQSTYFQFYNVNSNSRLCVAIVCDVKWYTSWVYTFWFEVKSLCFDFNILPIYLLHPSYQALAKLVCEGLLDFPSSSLCACNERNFGCILFKITAAKFYLTIAFSLFNLLHRIWLPDDNAVSFVKLRRCLVNELFYGMYRIGLNNRSGIFSPNFFANTYAGNNLVACGCARHIITRL